MSLKDTWEGLIVFACWRIFTSASNFFFGLYDVFIRVVLLIGLMTYVFLRSDPIEESLEFNDLTNSGVSANSDLSDERFVE